MEKTDNFIDFNFNLSDQPDQKSAANFHKSPTIADSQSNNSLATPETTTVSAEPVFVSESITISSELAPASESTLMAIEPAVTPAEPDTILDTADHSVTPAPTNLNHSVTPAPTNLNHSATSASIESDYSAIPAKSYTQTAASANLSATFAKNARKSTNQKTVNYFIAAAIALIIATIAGMIYLGNHTYWLHPDKKPNNETEESHSNGRYGESPSLTPKPTDNDNEAEAEEDSGNESDDNTKDNSDSKANKKDSSSNQNTSPKKQAAPSVQPVRPSTAPKNTTTPQTKPVAPIQTSPAPANSAAPTKPVANPAPNLPDTDDSEDSTLDNI